MLYDYLNPFFRSLRKPLAGTLAALLLLSPAQVIAEDGGGHENAVEQTEQTAQQTTEEQTEQEQTETADTAAPEPSLEEETGEQSSGENATTTPFSIETETPSASTTASSTDSLGGTDGDEVNYDDAEITGGGGSINTGSAAAVADVATVANTSFINSIGWFILLNLIFGLSDDLDISSLWDGISGAPSVCGSGFCSQGSALALNAENTNNATIANTVDATAITGANTAGGDGSQVTTGDAFAGVNILNVVNTNVVDSQYVLIAINNFGDWVGDLIFPTGEKLAETGGAAHGTTTVSSDNTAGVETSAEAGAETGGNTAGGGSSILSGAATALANVINRINQNLFGGTSLYIVIRVHGNWVGDVLNAPAGVTWQEEGGQIELFGELPGQNAGTFDSTTVTNTNSAEVKNAVRAYALTGQNAAGENSSIETGNAFAAVNVVNIVNTNIFGKNWILAVINIFGDWFGNISFGQPDLWIGGRAEITPNPAHEGKAVPGTPVTFHFTVSNNGDVRATNVMLSANSLKHISGVGVPPGLSTLKYSASGENIIFNLGTIAPGETRELSYAGILEWGGTYGDTLVTTEAGVSSSESDGNPADNTEDVSFVSYVEPPTGGGAITPANPNQGGNKPANMPKFDLKKMADPGAAIQGGETAYAIHIENLGGPSYKSVLIDVLRNPNGEIVYRKQWDLGEVKNGEKIIVDYTTRWGNSTPPGIYVNTAQIMAIGGGGSPSQGVPMLSQIATSSVLLVPKPQTGTILSSSSEGSDAGGELLPEESGIEVDCGGKCSDLEVPLISGNFDGKGGGLFGGLAQWNLAAVAPLGLHSYLWFSLLLSLLFIAYISRKREEEWV